LNDRLTLARQAKASLASMSQLLQSTSGSSASHICQFYWELANHKDGNSIRHFDSSQSTIASLDLSRTFRQQLQARSRDNKLSAKSLTNATALRTTGLAPFDQSQTVWRRVDPELLTIDFEAYCLAKRLVLINHTHEGQAMVEFSQPLLITIFERLFDAHWELAEPLTFAATTVRMSQ